MMTIKIVMFAARNIETRVINTDYAAAVVNQGYMRLIERDVVIVNKQRALAEERVIGCQLLSQFRILYVVTDELPDPRANGLILCLVMQGVPIQTDFLVGRWKFSLPINVPQLFTVAAGPEFCFKIGWCRFIFPPQAPCGRALKHVQGIDLIDDAGDHLRGGGAGTYNADALAGKNR